jgi:hypothetical protein
MCFKYIKIHNKWKKKLKNIVRLKKISTIKDFRFGTFPSISGSSSGHTFYRPPSESGKCTVYILTMKINHTLWLIEVIILFRRWIHRWKYIQYWSVDGKYRIYLTRLRNGVKDELLASLSPRFAPSQINSIFTVNRPILYLSCNPRCPKK